MARIGHAKIIPASASCVRYGCFAVSPCMVCATSVVALKMRQETTCRNHVNINPPTCITKEKKILYGPGHLASVNKFFSIRGESMLGRRFHNTTHQGDTQAASHEQKCLWFIGGFP